MPDFVYHYTSLEALVGILKKEEVKDSKEKIKDSSSLVFWGSRYDSMNDPQDYLFASQVVLPKIMDAIKNSEDLTEVQKETNTLFPYIVSFSENKDDESMWTNYNADICLKIDTKYLSPWIQEGEIITGFWGKCEYAKEEDLDEAFFKKWKNSIQYIENISSMAQHACVYIKRYNFRQENEWRLYMGDEILPQPCLDGTVYNTETPQNVKVKCIRNKDIVFYKEFKINGEALKGIVVNDVDYEHFSRVKKHLEILLVSRGFNPTQIKIEQTNRYPF